MQLAPAARLVPQLLVWANCAAFAPVMLTPVMPSAAVPGLDSVTVCAALVEPAVTLLNNRLVGLNTACGVVPVPIPVPFSRTVWFVDGMAFSASSVSTSDP